ncbi:MAG: hypothetical protein WKG07_44930 [Hymenobacter sp.]
MLLFSPADESRPGPALALAPTPLTAADAPAWADALARQGAHRAAPTPRRYAECRCLSQRAGPVAPHRGRRLGAGGGLADGATGRKAAKRAGVRGGARCPYPRWRRDAPGGRWPSEASYWPCMARVNQTHGDRDARDGAPRWEYSTCGKEQTLRW